MKRRITRDPKKTFVKSIPYGIAGSYKAVTEVPFRGVAAESLAWTLPGLLFPRREGHPRGRLVLFALLNATMLYVAKRRIADNPYVLEKPKWVLRESVLAWARYVLYAALLPRRTYWRGDLDNIAFFSQTWWPIALWGAARGPIWSAVAGPIHGYIFYLSAAWANGEPLIPPQDVLRKIANYSDTSIRAGLVCLIIFRTLHRASVEAETERTAISERLAAEEEERSIRRQAVEVRRDLAMSLLRVRKKAQETLPSELANRVAAPIDDALNRPWNREDAVTGSAFDMIDAIARDFPKPVRKIGDDYELNIKSIGVFEAVLYTALDNANVHAECSSIQVAVKVSKGRVNLRIVDDGVGLRGKPIEYVQNHGLTRTRLYVRDLDGELYVQDNSPSGVIVDAWWPL